MANDSMKLGDTAEVKLSASPGLTLLNPPVTCFLCNEKTSNIAQHWLSFECRYFQKVK